MYASLGGTLILRFYFPGLASWARDCSWGPRWPGRLSLYAFPIPLLRAMPASSALAAARTHCRRLAPIRSVANTGPGNAVTPARLGTRGAAGSQAKDAIMIEVIIPAPAGAPYPRPRIRRENEAPKSRSKGDCSSQRGGGDGRRTWVMAWSQPPPALRGGPFISRKLSSGEGRSRER